jgi:hypothetical protein
MAFRPWPVVRRSAKKYEEGPARESEKRYHRKGLFLGKRLVCADR